MKKEYKDFLDKLRESGKTNMFGAGVYLQKEFDLTRNEAKEVLSEWINSF